MRRPTLAIDFDGVIHSYEKGWQNGELYGTVTEGFFQWAQEAQQVFTLVIYSSRSRDVEGRTAMRQWLEQQFRLELNARRHRGEPELIGDTMPAFEYASTKPSAFLTIDDRCVRFDGNWRLLAPMQLRRFQPWHELNGSPVAQLSDRAPE